MKFGKLVVPLILIILAPLFLTAPTSTVSAQTPTKPDFFVGIDVAFDNITATKELADKMRPYTNLFIIGCSYGINVRNDSRLSDLFDLCQYLYNKGYYFIIFQNIAPMSQITEHVRQYGDRFLGFYAYDELGGRQLDQPDDEVHFEYADNLTDATMIFENRIKDFLYNSSTWGFCRTFNSPNEFKLFTSDYALYWFDYKGGYDCVFAEFSWNYDRQLNIALCRGAATTQGKEWGTIITWSHDDPPYIESPQDLYNDMVLSYDNGAKYIVVFDTNANWTESTLTEEHLEAIKQFWQYTQDNPRITSSPADRVAYVLPYGYAYGFRGPEDRIWGIWSADQASELLSDRITQNVNACQLISTSVAIMLNTYGSKVDIIYDEPTEPGASVYSQTVIWNDPNAVADAWPTVLPSASPSPTGRADKGIFGSNQIMYVIIGITAVAVGTAIGAFTLTRKKNQQTKTDLPA